MTVAMVVPTIREDCIKNFLDRWNPYPWHKTIVVEDNPEKTFQIADVDAHYCWGDIEQDFPSSDLFSRRDSAIKAYGFYKAAKEFGVSHVLTLDDDCLPTDNGTGKTQFVKRHLQALRPTEWVSSWPGLRVRGLPYADWGAVTGEVLVNMGFWTNVPDLDAIGMLTQPKDAIPKHPPVDTRMMHPSQLFPFCGMNVLFDVKALVAMYFPKMGEGVPYRRFDDIWAGLTSQHVLNSLGFAITAGPPHIYHDKASDAFVNLAKEAPGVAAHELFWPYVRSITWPDSVPRTPADYIYHLADRFMNVGSSVAEHLAQAPKNFGASAIKMADGPLAEYVEGYGKRLMVWHNAVKDLPAVRNRENAETA